MPLIGFLRSTYALPAVLAVLQVFGSAIELRDQPGTREIDSLAIVLLLAGPAALTVRRWWAREVVAFVLAITVAYHFLDYPEGPISASLIVAFIATFFHGHRTYAWAMMAVTYFSLFWLGYVLGLEPSPELDRALGAAAWMLAFFALFELGRGRRERMVEAGRVRREESKRRASEERLRIARELHDVLGHNLSLINVQAGTALHLMDERPGQARTALAAIKDASNEALHDLRSVLDVLREGGEEAPRTPMPTLGDIDDLVARTSVGGLTVSRRLDGTPRTLQPNVERAAFRVVQEALTNVTRHARATSAIVTVRYTDDALVVEIADDGVGAIDLVEGNGIAGMRERAVALGGRLDVSSTPSAFSVTASFPIAGGTG